MGNAVDLTGKRVGRWLVLSRSRPGNSSEIRWDCLCDCGVRRSVLRHNLTTGATQSCGCLKAQTSHFSCRTHGQSRSPEYRIWQAMKKRCSDPKDHAYPNYGGRGIKVCDRWQDFGAFYSDICPRPSKELTLDRIDNDGNYEPGNCRWATRKEQSANQRPKRLRQIVTVRGRTAPLLVLAHEAGIKVNTVRARLASNWSLEKALTLPVIR